MLNVENVATPLTAVTLVVPDSVPPLGFAPIPTVIDPVNPVTTFPASSSAETCIAGIVWPAWVACGCVVKATWVAGGAGGGGGEFGGGAALSENVATSHGRAGSPYIQVHCGSTVPALARTAYSASSRMYRSDPRPQGMPPTHRSWLKGVPGSPTPVNPPPPVVSNAPIVAVYTSPPAFTAIGRVWAGMLAPTSVPLAWATSLSAAAKLSSMPLHAEILMPPSTTRWCINARTARIWPDTELESGKFWMFVATNVAIEYPPAVT